MKKSNLPWGKLPEESDDLYDMFMDYLELGEKRSYEAIAQMYAKSVRTIKYYGRKFNWVERVKAWDNYINHEHVYPLLEKFRNYENEKMQLKLNVSVACLELVQSLKNYLEDTSVLYANTEILKHLKYLREVSRTVNQLLNMADFSLPPILNKVTAVKNLNIKKIINPDYEPKEPFVVNDIKTINLFVDALMNINTRITPPTNPDNPDYTYSLEDENSGLERATLEEPTFEVDEIKGDIESAPLHLPASESAKGTNDVEMSPSSQGSNESHSYQDYNGSHSGQDFRPDSQEDKESALKHAIQVDNNLEVLENKPLTPNPQLHPTSPKGAKRINENEHHTHSP